MLSPKEQSLLDALSAEAEGHGIEIVTIELVGAKKAPTIRVFIDTENGVDFDALVAAQSWINPLIEELDPFPGAYQLEVSSPGIDRPLRTPAHFAKQIGETVALRTSSAVDGRSNFTGTLKAANDDAIVMECEQGGAVVAFTIPYAAIKKANLKGKVNF